jgi:hypothetical protein
MSQEQLGATARGSGIRVNAAERYQAVGLRLNLLAEFGAGLISGGNSRLPETTGNLQLL